MPSFDCSKCVPTINVPDDWTTEKKSEVAGLIRKKDSFMTVQYFRPIGMDLGVAKGIFMHVTREKGFYHRCRKELIEYEGQCPKCKSLNLDW